MLSSTLGPLILLFAPLLFSLLEKVLQSDSCIGFAQVVFNKSVHVLFREWILDINFVKFELPADWSVRLQFLVRWWLGLHTSKFLNWGSVFSFVNCSGPLRWIRSHNFALTVLQYWVILSLSRSIHTLSKLRCFNVILNWINWMVRH